MYAPWLGNSARMRDVEIFALFCVPGHAHTCDLGTWCTCSVSRGRLGHCVGVLCHVVCLKRNWHGGSVCWRPRAMLTSSFRGVPGRHRESS